MRFRFSHRGHVLHGYSPPRISPSTESTLLRSVQLRSPPSSDQSSFAVHPPQTSPPSLVLCRSAQSTHRRRVPPRFAEAVRGRRRRREYCGRRRRRAPLRAAAGRRRRERRGGSGASPRPGGGTRSDGRNGPKVPAAPAAHRASAAVKSGEWRVFRRL